jgi:hypothetical protein
LGYWKNAIGERPVTVKELIDTVTDRPSYRERPLRYRRLSRASVIKGRTT